MKKNYIWVCWTCILLWVAMSGVSAYAGDDDMIIVNIKGSEIVTPVKLKTSKGVFTIRNRFVYNGWLQIYGAEDANGRKINVNKASTEYRNGSVIATYELTWLYSDYSSNESYSNDYNSYNDTGSTIGNAVYSTVESIGNAVSQGAVIKVDGYPYGALSVGLSRFYGEFARLSLKVGGWTGFNFYGGVGKDWIFNLENSDKLAWHVGAGMYMSFGKSGDWYDCNQAVTLNVAFGETPVVINKAFVFEATYEYFFGKSQRIGAFGGFGLSLGNLDATEPVIDWDFQVGVAVKLFTY